MTDKCMRVGCTNDATVAIKVSMPAVGAPIEPGTLLHAIVGLKACQCCFDKTPLEEILRPEIKDMFNDIMAQQGKMQPDYERATLSPVELGSDEYKMYLRMRGRQLN